MVKKGILHGKPIIILEELPNAIVWIEEEAFTKKCEDIFEEVKKDPMHKLRGKMFKQAIKEDVKNEMGYGKYKAGLEALGVI